MKPSTKLKLFFNIVIFVVIFGLMFYFAQNYLGEIFAELAETNGNILVIIFALGMGYLFFEGWSIQAIVQAFSKKFRIRDGMLTAFYVAFYRVITFGAGTLISEVNFYSHKGLKISQGLGVTSLHMMMYKASILTYAIIGLIIQFPLMFTYAPGVIPLIIVGMVLTTVIILVFFLFSVSVNLQVLFIVICHRWLKNRRLRQLVDRCNLQIYSLRETVYSILHNRTALIKIYLLNMVKLIMWYVIPFICLIVDHPELDFLLVFSLMSFAMVLAGVIPAPAGLGGFEVVYMFLFTPLVGTVDAASSLLLYRFASYMLPFLLGFIQTLITRKNIISSELEELKTKKK